MFLLLPLTHDTAPLILAYVNHCVCDVNWVYLLKNRIRVRFLEF